MNYRKNTTQQVVTHKAIPVKNLRRWTLAAIDCYNRKGMCSECPIINIMETTCNMDFTVQALIKKFGKPTKELYERLLHEEAD